MKDAEGGCLCGANRYRLRGLPVSSIVCHCSTCRKASGALSVGWLTFDMSRYERLAGQAHVFASSPEVLRSFCANCGTPLTYVHSASPNMIDVTSVSLDDAALFPPTREVWLESKVSWEATNPGLDHYPRASTGGPLPVPAKSDAP